MNDLVLIPGLGSDGAVWARTIEHLDDAIRWMIGDTLHDRTLTDMAHRILGAAPPTFVLAGVSMGGMVALEILRLAPERVTALALVDSNPFPDSPEQAEQRRRTVAAIRLGVDLRAAGEASLAWLVHPDTASDIRQDIVEMGIRVGAEPYARQVEAVLNRGDQRPILRTITVPVVVITGAEDAMIPPSVAQAACAEIPNSDLRVIPRCGHLPPIEQPAIVAELLHRLIGQLSPECGNPSGR